MKVLLVSNSISGGAGKACLRLYEALIGSGQEAKILLLEGGESIDPNIVSFYPRVRDLFLRQMTCFPVTFLRHFLIGDYRRKYRLPSSIHRMERHPLIEWADVINLHWVADFVDYSNFFGRIGDKPVVWTMHDMLPFASGYHYETERPSVNLRAERRIAKAKNVAIKEANLSIVAPSSWLLGVSEKNKTFAGLLHRHIFNGLPLDTYRPLEKSIARRILGLPEDKRVLLFTAAGVNAKRKGGHLLMEAIRRLNNKNLVFVSVGGGSMDVGAQLEHRHLGAFADEISMALCYNSADVVVQPSIEDNSPNIIIESFACGRPVVGFDIGGVSELIDDNALGVLVSQLNGEALANGIEEALETNYSVNRIWKDASNRFSYAQLSTNYLSLFEEVCLG